MMEVFNQAMNVNWVPLIQILTQLLSEVIRDNTVVN